MKTAIATYRESTEDQGKSGNGLAAQKRTVHLWASANEVTIIGEYTDIASGKSTNGRHELAKAIARMNAHEADILVSAKLDRLTRSVVDFGTMLETARDNGWALVVCDINLDMSTAIGEMVANIVASVAQFERRRIADRTREALAEIPRGVTHTDKHGNVKNPPGGISTVPADVIAVAKYLHSEGKSLRQIGAALTDMGKPAPNGGAVWHPAAVKRVIER